MSPKFMLIMHFKMYARNGSLKIFRDPLGKTINDSNCSWSDTNLADYKFNDTKEECCVSVKTDQRKTLSGQMLKQ